MKQRLKALLEHLLDVLDAGRQAEIENLHRRALSWEPVDRLPLVITHPLSDDMPFKPYPHSETFGDPEKMLFNELVYAFDTSIASRGELNDDLPCTIRANFGTVIIASMFGAHVEQIENNPPWVLHNGSSDTRLEAVLEHDPMDFSKGWCPRVVEMYQFYRSVLESYPDLKAMIKIVLPDLQGPFDNLELIAGSGLFAELYANPDLVSRALEAVTTAQIGFAQYLGPYVTDENNGFSHQHATTIRGNILLRDDSVILMSPEMYRNRVAPYDERVLREMGGGGIHSCGRIDHHTEAFLELPSIRCLDLGQPELNDLDALYERAKERRVPLIRIAPSEEELISGRIVERFPTGVSLRYEAGSLEEGRRIMRAYLDAAEKRNKNHMVEQMKDEYVARINNLRRSLQ